MPKYTTVYVVLVKTCDIWTLHNQAKNLITEEKTMEKGSPYAKLFERHVGMKSRRNIWEQHTQPSTTTGDDDGLFYVDVFRAKHCLPSV